MAAPVIAGALALMLQREPALTTAPARELLARSARHDWTRAWTPAYGHGKLDVARRRPGRLIKPPTTGTVERSASRVVLTRGRHESRLARTMPCCWGKQTAGGPSVRDREVVPVLAEPRPGHEEAEMVGRLRALGASRIEVLTPGFVSASIEHGGLGQLEDLAEVDIKPRKRPLGRGR